MLYWHRLTPLWEGFGLLRNGQKVVSTLHPMVQISHLGTMNHTLIATLDETNLIHHSTHGGISLLGIVSHVVMPDTTEIEVYRIGACMASEGPHMCRKQHGTYNVWRIQSGVLRTCGAIVSNKKKIGTRIVG